MNENSATVRDMESRMKREGHRSIQGLGLGWRRGLWIGIMYCQSRVALTEKNGNIEFKNHTDGSPLESLSKAWKSKGVLWNLL
jgi:hypothetical protein